MMFVIENGQNFLKRIVTVCRWVCMIPVSSYDQLNNNGFTWTVLSVRASVGFVMWSALPTAAMAYFLMLGPQEPANLICHLSLVSCFLFAPTCAAKLLDEVDIPAHSIEVSVLYAVRDLACILTKLVLLCCSAYQLPMAVRLIGTFVYANLTAYLQIEVFMYLLRGLCLLIQSRCRLAGSGNLVATKNMAATLTKVEQNVQLFEGLMRAAGPLLLLMFSVSTLMVLVMTFWLVSNQREDGGFATDVFYILLGAMTILFTSQDVEDAYRAVKAMDIVLRCTWAS